MNNNNFQNFQNQSQAQGSVPGSHDFHGPFGPVPPSPPVPPFQAAPGGPGSRRELFIKGLPFIAVIPFIQGLLLWICLSDVTEELYYLYEFSFPLPTAACLVAPLFLYLNWDFWRPGSRRVLLGMTLGVAIVLFSFDIYAFWAEVGKYDVLSELVFFLGFALILVFPVFRQRLYATGSQAGRALAESSIFKDPPADQLEPPYSNLPVGAKAWIPQGRVYLEELIRLGILLAAAMIVCAVAGIFLFFMGEMISSATSWYYYGSGVELFGQFMISATLAYAAAIGIVFLACLRPVSIFSHWVLKISAWGNFLGLFFAVFGLFMLPFILYFESEMYSFFVLSPMLALGLMAAASSRLFGPLTHPVCAIITRIGSFLPIIFALATAWQVYMWQDAYTDPENVIMLVYTAWLLVFAVGAAAAGGANRLYQWFSLLTPGLFILAAFLILLMLSPALDPNRIAAASYARYLVDEEYEQEYTYNHLYYYYNIWGQRELKELARRPGETEKDKTIREMAQTTIDRQGDYSHYNESYSYDDGDENSPSYPSREEQEARLRRLPVWPAGKTVPDELYESLSDPYSLTLDENTCSRFFVADFNQDGVDDVMFLDSERGDWTVYKAVPCAKFEDMGYSICDSEMEYYKEELQTEPHTLYSSYRYDYSGYVASDYLSGENLCRELNANLEKGTIGLEPPKPETLHLRIGDMLIESGR